MPRFNRRRHDLQRRYGITPAQYDALLAAQDGCAICGDKGSRLTVDHCHFTDTVRGLLCHGCNLGLGKFNDSPALVERALHYLLTPPIRTLRQQRDNQDPCLQSLASSTERPQA